jgi:biopolymer transport protein TolR
VAMNLSSAGGRNRGRRRSNSRAPMAEINITPMVDVMLVLLIIFMVTAPLLTTGVPVQLPESRANALDIKKEPVELTIDKQGTVTIDGVATKEDALSAALTTIAANQSAKEPRQIMLRADKGIDYGRIMRVMGELNRAGLNSISLVTTGSSGDQ